MFRRSTNARERRSGSLEGHRGENQRQEDHIELIASENYASIAVMAAQGSQLTNKYAEGYPGKRYYGGCEYVDIVEQLAIDRVKKLFHAEAANVQPHSGAQANQAVFFATLKPGDTILGMSLPHGGHLTHGSPVNMSGKWFNVVPYGLDPETELIDYAAAERLAHEHKPKLIVAGASAYSRVIDWKRFRDDRRRRRRAAHGRHGALRRSRRRGRLSVAGRHRRLHDQHDAQDAARTARRHHPRPRRAREGDELRGVSRPAGRPADARHRRQGRRVRRGAAPRFPRLPGAGPRERARAGARAGGSRPAHRVRRHRLPHVPGRPARRSGSPARTPRPRSAARTSRSTRTRSRTIPRSRSSRRASASAARRSRRAASPRSSARSSRTSSPTCSTRRTTTTHDQRVRGGVAALTRDVPGVLRRSAAPVRRHRAPHGSPAMKCPFCGSAETQVIDSRVSEPGDSIRRRRRCLDCQKRFTTYETVELRLPQVVKTNGNRSDFDSRQDPRRLRARAAQASGAHRVRRRGDRPHRRAGAVARRARDRVAADRRDGDAGALQARQGRVHPVRVGLPLVPDVSDFRDALREVEAPPPAAKRPRR